MSKILKIIAALVVLLILAQFVPYGKDHTNPKVIAEPKWDSPQTREYFMRACGNCHSNETTYPAYSNYAPISWLIQMDIDEGRKHLNVSEWGRSGKNEGDEAAGAFEEGDMPPWFYMPTHPEAQLSDTERTAFLKGLIATFGEKQ